MLVAAISVSIRQRRQGIRLRSNRLGAARKTVPFEQLKEAPPVFVRKPRRPAYISRASDESILQISFLKLAYCSCFLRFERLGSRRCWLVQAFDFDVLYQFSPIQNDCTLKNVFEFTDVPRPVVAH